ncbi:MAG: hypothetical protein O6948_14550, partial [Deltaproteobacteria bacterium]|nr:hypothetical protein [Deltaproteobacteria bacterium]
IGGDKKRKDKTTILGPYVFRVTTYGQRDDALDMWLLYFERLGVPAAIIKNGKNYSVWKYGLEYISSDWSPKLKSPTGEIIEEVNNFKDYLSKQNKAA